MIAAAEEKMKAHATVANFEVWQENWDSFSLFVGAETQWTVGVGMAGVLWVGLDYDRLETVMRLRGIPRRERSRLFADVQIMERAALPVLNDK